MQRFAAALVLLMLAGLGVFVAAGFRPGPVIDIRHPDRFVGRATPVEVGVEAPGGRLVSLTVEFEQNGTRTPLSTLADAPVTSDGPDAVTVTGEVGRETVPGLQAGAGRIVVTAERPVLYGLRTARSEAARDVEVRLDPPRLSVLSTHHYVNLGGAEMVVYRVTPDDVESGVRVGDLEYPGYPGSGIAVEGARSTDPSVRVAFFALLHDQPADTPVRLFARDPAGNAAGANLDARVFPKTFRRSRINLDDTFIERVVPAILATTTEIAPEGAMIDRYVAINSELRRRNAETIAGFAGRTAPEMLWGGVPFHPFTNNAVESGFADHRTYYYQGREVDRQVHLGFDLASYARTPILAANRGRVLFAGELGIYGNCVIIDHGMGLQSLYAHLSEIGVAEGDEVDKAQPIGRSGMTGLAGGDHLHFTMLLNGQMINPIEWWDPHWIEDRILRKLRATP